MVCETKLAYCIISMEITDQGFGLYSIYHLVLYPTAWLEWHIIRQGIQHNSHIEHPYAPGQVQLHRIDDAAAILSGNGSASQRCRAWFIKFEKSAASGPGHAFTL